MSETFFNILSVSDIETCFADTVHLHPPPSSDRTGQWGHLSVRGGRIVRPLTPSRSRRNKAPGSPPVM